MQGIHFTLLRFAQKKSKQVWRTMTDTFWTFCGPRFLLCVYLRREAKAGFDEQGWILLLCFMSIGVTLGDKTSVRQKAELGSQPGGRQAPWEPERDPQGEASQTGDMDPQWRPWGRTETSPSPGHVWGFVDIKQERVEKRLRWQVAHKGQRAATQRTLGEELGKKERRTRTPTLRKPWPGS